MSLYDYVHVLAFLVMSCVLVLPAAVVFALVSFVGRTRSLSISLCASATLLPLACTRGWVTTSIVRC